MTTRARRFLAGFVLTTSLVTAQASQAIEPQNNEAPWKWWISAGDLTLYTAEQLGAGWSIGVERIASSSDVDHVYLACDGRPVTAAQVNLNHASGDIDMEVFDLAGNYLGASRGVGDEERVDVKAFGKQMVVVKVYGYNGAINDYGLYAQCY
jgi:hypothetical protein